MTKIQSSLILCLLALGIDLACASEPINCSVDGSEISQCKASTQQPDTLGHNLKITSEIDLNPVIKSFRKLISKKLNRKTCEKKIFVKSAKLKLKNNSLEVDIRARLNRQYCTRRAKALVYEKTNNLKYSLSPIVTATQIKFVAKNPDEKQASFEKSFTDVVEMNIKDKISLVLNQILVLGVENIKLSLVPESPLIYRSAVIDPNSNRLIVEMTTSIVNNE